MKLSTILSIAAIFVVAVAAGPAPVEEYVVAAAPEGLEVLEVSDFLGTPIEGGTKKREGTFGSLRTVSRTLCSLIDFC